MTPTFKTHGSGPLARVKKGEWGGGHDIPAPTCSQPSAWGAVWMGCFQLQVHSAAARTARLFGQISRQGVYRGGPWRPPG